jgi:hypothetical protein
VAGSYLDVTQVHSGIEHGRDECTAQHMRVRPGDPYTGCLREPPQAPGGGVAVHPGAAAVEQDRTARAGACRLVDGAPHGRRQQDQDHLGAFAAHAQHLVAVLLAEVGDARAGVLEDPQAKQPEHGHQREVTGIGGLAGGGEQGLELQVRKPEGR